MITKHEKSVLELISEHQALLKQQSYFSESRR